MARWRCGPCVLLLGCGPQAAPSSVTILPLPAASVTAAVANDRPSPLPWGPNERFRLSVEQHDVRVPVVDHAVTLRRNPFTLVFEMRGTEYLAVNASYAPDLAHRARARASIEDVFGPGNGMAEEDPPPKGIFIRDDAFNYWGWGNDAHRCHVHTTQGDTVVCKRVIEVLREGAVKTLPLVSWRGDPLYLVVEASNDEGDEAQRDWLTISFR